MYAHLITLARVVLAFVAVGLYELDFYFQAAALVLTIVVIYMDALDGVVARKLGVASEFGALMDITGDRIVEMVFWIYFAVKGDVTFWIPALIIARAFLTDTVRSLAFSEGKTPFGEKTLQTSRWGRWLVTSRVSRGVYGVTKAVVFCWLGGAIVLASAEWHFVFALPGRLWAGIEVTSTVLVYTTFVLCIARGVPVLWDSREMLTRRMFPRSHDV